MHIDWWMPIDWCGNGGSPGCADGRYCGCGAAPLVHRRAGGAHRHRRRAGCALRHRRRFLRRPLGVSEDELRIRLPPRHRLRLFIGSHRRHRSRQRARRGVHGRFSFSFGFSSAVFTHSKPPAPDACAPEPGLRRHSRQRVRHRAHDMNLRPVIVVRGSRRPAVAIDVSLVGARLASILDPGWRLGSAVDVRSAPVRRACGRPRSDIRMRGRASSVAERHVADRPFTPEGDARHAHAQTRQPPPIGRAPRPAAAESPSAGGPPAAPGSDPTSHGRCSAAAERHP